jgi:1-acyl-sn-glycerol-3-phosphate acyltransferase
VVLRLAWMFGSVFGLLLPMYLARLLGFKRLSQYLVRLACQSCLRAVGLTLSVTGTPMRGAGAIVANHASWMDIFVLNAVHRIYFVAKSEVAKWPLIGLVARSVGTVFIRRQARDAPQQKAVFLDRITQGDRLLFFPEGTSTDGQRVLPFKSTLFAAFFEEGLRDRMWVQPVTVRYVAPDGYDPWFYAWWGDTEFAAHLLAILSPVRKGEVHLTFHDPLRVSDFPDRKLLASAAEHAVRSGMKD